MKERIERIKQEKVPIRDNSAKEALLAFDPNLEQPINKLADLSKEMQDNIFAYILHKRNEGMPKEQVTELLDFLINKTFEMLNLSDDQSDKNPKPAPSNLSPELERQVEEVVARRIKEAEMTITKDDFVPQGIGKYKH